VCAISCRLPNNRISAAAERMNVVQSAISQQIKRLEEELDTKLFERSGNGLRLTEAGRQMLPECRRLVQADKTIKIVKSVGAGSRGKINFAFVDNSISSLIPPLVGEEQIERPWQLWKAAARSARSPITRT
jgi:DNA-binding transcriptional LysR family regulator